MAKTANKSELPTYDTTDLVKVNFCIPPLGTKLILAEPWSFDLFYESRNSTLIETLNLKRTVSDPVEKRKSVTTRPGYDYQNLDSKGMPRITLVREEHEYDYTPTHVEWEGGVTPSYGQIIKRVTLPRGAKLSVSRIYIRNGVKAYNSVTFTLIKEKKKKGEPPSPHGRFWAKLYDVNQIVCYPVGVDAEVNAVWKKPETNHLKTFKFVDINDPLE